MHRISIVKKLINQGFFAAKCFLEKFSKLEIVDQYTSLKTQSADISSQDVHSITPNKGFKGVDMINGEYPPGVFLRGLKFSGKKIRGLKFLGDNLRGLKSISKFDQNLFKISNFLEVTDPNIAKIVTISEIRIANEIKK